MCCFLQIFKHNLEIAYFNLCKFWSHIKSFYHFNIRFWSDKKIFYRIVWLRHTVFKEFLYWILYFYVARATDAPLFNGLFPLFVQRNEIFLSFALFMFNSLVLSITILPLMTSLNRLTAILYPVSYDIVIQHFK